MSEAGGEAAHDETGMNPRNVANLGAGLIAAFCWLFGAYLLWTGSQARALAAAADRFEQSAGRVVDAGIKARGGTGQSRAQIAVAYRVDGRDYDLSTNGSDLRLRFAGDADALLMAYPIGREVAVHYDPQAPEVATLSPELEPDRAWASGFGVLGLAALVSVWAWRRRKTAA